ncbi:beta-galactosidase 8-like [Senna tora]|uniref:Beta-galactosidase n=1 Tax=Senna tora TaxID=362788 RepID=A0A834SJR0_9FABA|nr:beta-galactosidase 8-like [Senna tora]
MWPHLIQKAKDGGLNMIETYVFWNKHEPVPGQYNFEGGNDIVKFLNLVAAAGLYVHLRIGPYVCAEWNYGGFPVWLHLIPGIQFRTDNQPFKAQMQRFTAKIVDLMKQNKLFASQGGPIVMSQIENEYGNIHWAHGAAGKTYINWAASMASSLDTGVPWNMCQQPDAPHPMINTCNGFYCDQFTPNSDQKPKMWTEMWSGWFLTFGSAVPYRPVEDVAFAVARFFQRGGTLNNYYMYHGGTNFGRTSGGPFISTSYDYDAPIDEYGHIRQPKWGHLKDLHKTIMLCEEALIATDPNITSLGHNLEAAVYQTESSCAAFLANVDAKSDAKVRFRGKSYNLPAWSVSILPDCKNVAFNTAKINSVSMTSSFTREPLREDINSVEGSMARWVWISEPVGISGADTFTRRGLLEQITTTADKSDYLWYSLSIDLEDDGGPQTVLHIESLGHALHAFINGKLAGSGIGDSAKVVDIPVTLVARKNKIDLLSLTVGLQNSGAFFDRAGAGITGPVILNGLKNGSSLNLTSYHWTYQIGLRGDHLGLSAGSSEQWISGPSLPKNQPLTWYKQSFFAAPSGSNPVAIDLTGMGKGEAWINGQSIGRFWPTLVAPNNGCTEACDYRGSYSQTKCLKNCGQPSQSLYHVPRSWLKPRDNVIVLFEEVGGDPTKITFVTRQIGSLCAHVSESHPPPLDLWNSDTKSRKKRGPVLSLQCPYPNQVISSIKFASFGTPQGACGNFSHGSCSSSTSLSILEKACVGSRNCSVGVSVHTFGDACRGVSKSLAVEAACT